ncbi:D-2-hydroxyacid dehydrogenase [Saccharibacillus sp. CPCC 101409]|uniref:D-2-hydroxyacid dehydrogenase n=1 Tax=Saccharibacillus sp. CPCC 101409 TaxID=3058041 RepID=UPI0026734497|nr:D-2-hydroxyacid dehydrogenase [Saccharibacillus sp. CPCC 101409]MDO3408568.1 D-2-hydroxyacid dehydrogenase [Saccharibacillus sp. CPCC 101409]
MPTIVSLYELPEDQTRKIQEIAPDYEFKTVPIKEVTPEQIKEADILLGWNRKMEDAALESDNLKWIQAWSAGVDYFPMDRLKEKNVRLTTAGGVHAIPISEHIFAVLLSMTRSLHANIRSQAQGVWQKDGNYGEIAGRTMAIVGTGHIGRQTAKIAKAFGMRTIGVRHSGRPEEHIDEMYKTDGIEEAFGKADVIVNILPLTDETRRFFNKDSLAYVKKGALFINVGRGQSVDTDALIEALDSGRLSGAALDVFEQEPLPEDHPLWKRDDVVITPHVAGNTDHYDERAAEIFIANLEAFVKGKELPRNLVDLDKRY